MNYIVTKSIVCHGFYRDRHDNKFADPRSARFLT